MNLTLKYFDIITKYIRRRLKGRYNSECLQLYVKGGGSVMVLGYILASGVGSLVKSDYNINAEKYRQILILNAVQSGKRLIGNSFIFSMKMDVNTLPM